MVNQESTFKLKPKGKSQKERTPFVQRVRGLIGRAPPGLGKEERDLSGPVPSWKELVQDFWDQDQVKPKVQAPPGTCAA